MEVTDYVNDKIKLEKYSTRQEITTVSLYNSNRKRNENRKNEGANYVVGKWTEKGCIYAK